ncbi:hypothetical protein ABD76_16885 [Paenibacillus dendritiformis]|uniref:hypothetical protein n=1 Tax=Paenibacillus dendritiformis TaxID=130049 RepID=UPI0018CFC7F5|nr:hypothetical protein [Paenibacillus dendritiformis]MBG9794100.1 hypothetical protein [Paenibacillus dendritiformis]
MNREKIEALIDELTPCLIHRETGEEYKTNIEPLKYSDLKQLTEKQGWVNFDWKKEYCAPNRLVYKLMVVGSDEIQGLVSLEVAQGYIDVFLVESAPWNIGSASQVFIGVGAHLFAFACKVSFERGFEGVIAFTSKTKLFKHYQEKLGAARIDGHLMTIETSAAKKLVNQYFGEGDS